MVAYSFQDFTNPLSERNKPYPFFNAFIEIDLSGTGGVSNDDVAVPGRIMVAFNIFNEWISRNFAISCENFYVINRRYFDGTEMFQEKLGFLALTFLANIYPFF